LRHEHWVCVPQDTKFNKEIITEAHYTPYMTHPGPIKMYQHL